ncbi:B3/4 domain-containing protein [Streptomyces sp. B93]|uniref:B3/B4 domain-containing protein n=1 Tax=Streptomyces sp. B93 TaxID=2824875 RepID=UPI001B36C9E9|nr:phenylalanine--tRNA ligase beta subunit-related protein [Streptomyces sp. B93]MBQ1092547.1 cytoplasmic protein [Streptomyces sp. B93]
MTLTLTVSDEVRALAPGFTPVVVEAHGLTNGPSTEASSTLLDDAARRLAARLAGRAPHEDPHMAAWRAPHEDPHMAAWRAPHEDPHMAAWRAVYTAFGSKPSRTRNSAEALAKRALSDAGLPRINALVDLYNAISVAHLIPVGGEDIDRIKGGMRLVRATGDEDFITVAGGAEAVEHPDAGEVVWRDDLGVTCRRWNWRQGPRTRLTEDTVSGVFLLEGLHPVPVADIEAAAVELAELLEKFSPGADVTVRAGG